MSFSAQTVFSLSCAIRFRFRTDFAQRHHAFLQQIARQQRYHFLGQGRIVGFLRIQADGAVVATKLAEVDTGRLGSRGAHGVAIAQPDGKPLGTFRHFLMLGTLGRGGRDDGYTSLRLHAFNALGSNHGVRVPTMLATEFAVRGLPSGAKVACDGGRLTLSLPASDKAQRAFTVRRTSVARERLNPPAVQGR